MDETEKKIRAAIGASQKKKEALRDGVLSAALHPVTKKSNSVLGAVGSVIGVILLISQFGVISNCLNMIEADLSAIDMDEINRAITDFSEVADQLKSIDIATVNEAIANLSDAAEKFTAFDITSVNDAVNALTQAAEKLAKVDIASLNRTVKSLKGAADSLSAVDVKALNDLVTALESTASNLEEVSSTLAGIGSIFKG